MTKKLFSPTKAPGTDNVSSLMATSPNRLQASAAKTHSASIHPPSAAAAAREAQVNAGGDKVVSRPNHFPMFRKKPGSRPAASETIFSGPTSAPPKIQRMSSVASKLHSDPFDSARQQSLPKHFLKKKLQTPRHQTAAKFGTKRTNTKLTIAAGFVAGSNLVFAGGKKQFEATRRTDPSKSASPLRHDCPASAAAGGESSGAPPAASAAAPPVRRMVRPVASPVHADPKLLHFDPHASQALTATKSASRSSRCREAESTLKGGVCRPVERKSVFTRAHTEAVIHPPWHTSTPRDNRGAAGTRLERSATRHSPAGTAAAASPGGGSAVRRPPWHTDTPRTAASGSGSGSPAAAARGLRQVAVPGANSADASVRRTGVKQLRISAGPGGGEVASALNSHSPAAASSPPPSCGGGALFASPSPVAVPSLRVVQAGSA